MNIMDLTQLDLVEKANAGSLMEVTYPANGTNPETGEPFYKGEVIIDADGNPWSVTLLGSDSDIYRNAQKRKLESRFNSKKKNGADKVDLDEEQRKGAELMAKCSIDCNIYEGKGKKVQCTPSEMVRLYLKYPWLREQAETYMTDRDNLMTN
jgi:hypothetical protein